MRLELFPITVSSPRGTRVVGRAATLPPIRAVVNGLGEQIFQRPVHRQSFWIPPRGRPATSAPATGVSFSAGATLAVEVEVFSPELMSAARGTTYAVAPTRSV